MGRTLTHHKTIVMEMALLGLPVSAMLRVTGHGEALLEEHLAARIARNFGFDLKQLAAEKKLALLYTSPVELNKSLNTLSPKERVRAWAGRSPAPLTSLPRRPLPGRPRRNKKEQEYG